MNRTLNLTLKISLWLLLVAATFNALLLLQVGLTFGPSLWDATNPSPTIHWLAAIAFPVLLFTLLKRQGVPAKKLVLVWLGAWAFTAYYVLFYLGDGHILDCGLRWSC
jgi:hypothetical protein